MALGNAQVGSADFSAYLGTADARAATLAELEALARMRVALERPLTAREYAELRAKMQRPQ